jgi:hypothetical protein
MTDDTKQRRLEALKMRLDFLKHLTTLSGAATVVVLTLLQLGPSPRIISGLAIVVLMFALVFLVSTVGMLVMIDMFETKGAESPHFSTGRRTSAMAGALFGAGVFALINVAFGLPLARTLVLTIVVMVVLYAMLVVLARWVAKTTEAEKEAPDEGDQARPDAPGAQEGVQRPWWRRMFGG